MNQTEFKVFYTECWKYCKPRLRNLTTHQADIEDVFAEAISRFWVNSQAGKITHFDNQFGLVYVMAKNFWLSNLRKEKGHFSVSISANDEDDFEVQLPAEDQDFINKMISDKDNFEKEATIKNAWERLDVKCKDLLNATIIYKERQEDLLEKMNFKNTDTVKATKYRCLQYLKKYYYELAA